MTEINREEFLELRREFRDSIDRFSDTLEDVKTVLRDHSVLIAKLIERDEEHKRNIERFWTSDWQRMETRCTAHHQRTTESEKAFVLLQREVTACSKVLAETVATVQQIQEARWKLAGAISVIAFLSGVAGSLLAG